jgi:hypothetical protein
MVFKTQISFLASMKTLPYYCNYQKSFLKPSLYRACRGLSESYNYKIDAEAAYDAMMRKISRTF